MQEYSHISDSDMIGRAFELIEKIPSLPTRDQKLAYAQGAIQELQRQKLQVKSPKKLAKLEMAIRRWQGVLVEFEKVQP